VLWATCNLLVTSSQYSHPSALLTTLESHRVTQHAVLQKLKADKFSFYTGIDNVRKSSSLDPVLSQIIHISVLSCVSGVAPEKAAYVTYILQRSWIMNMHLSHNSALKTLNWLLYVLLYRQFYRLFFKRFCKIN